MGEIGGTEAARGQGRTWQRSAARARRSGGTKPALCGDVCHLRNAVVYRAGMEMVYVLEMRGHEHGDGDGVMLPEAASEVIRDE